MIIPERLMVGVRMRQLLHSSKLVKVMGSREPGICMPWWHSSQLWEQSGSFIINSKKSMNKESGNRNEKGSDSSRCPSISALVLWPQLLLLLAFGRGRGRAWCYWLILSLQPFTSSLHQSESSVCMQINNQVHLDSVLHLHRSRTKLAYSPKYKRNLGSSFLPGNPLLPALPPQPCCSISQ